MGEGRLVGIRVRALEVLVSVNLYVRSRYDSLHALFHDEMEWY